MVQEAVYEREEGGEEVKMDLYVSYTTTPPWDNHPSGEPPGTVDVRYGSNIIFLSKNSTAKVEKSVSCDTCTIEMTCLIIFLMIKSSWG